MEKVIMDYLVLFLWNYKSIEIHKFLMNRLISSSNSFI